MNMNIDTFILCVACILMLYLTLCAYIYEKKNRLTTMPPRYARGLADTIALPGQALTDSILWDVRLRNSNLDYTFDCTCSGCVTHAFINADGYMVISTAENNSPTPREGTVHVSYFGQNYGKQAVVQQGEQPV
ncbi:MAG: hypothetical protein LBL97_02985 [Prevotellaceae bacterium]|jgi:hypothetical protein|nr:hypothetical protein [Prevotellaceae bacterium]